MVDQQGKPSLNAGVSPVAKAVVSRLSLYLRELQRLLTLEIETTSSTQLGSLLGFTDTQVRKDLANFGQFGYPGVGYRCGELVVEIKKILGTDRQWPVVIIGVGNLGRALLGYQGFINQGFNVKAAFDTDLNKTGRQIENVPVLALDQLADFVAQNGIKLGIIAVPAQAAQEVADKIVAAGIEGVLNFAPVTLTLPDGVSRVGVDLAVEMEQLSYSLTNRLTDQN